jgi:uncharacterized coiled-coil protein SlyX
MIETTIIAVESALLLLLMIALRERALVIKTLQKQLLERHRTLNNQASSIRQLRARIKSMEQSAAPGEVQREWPEVIE